MAAKTEMMTETLETAIPEEQATCKSVRRRRKRLLECIRSQIEFYLSDANLRKDRYLHNLMKSLGDDSTGTTFVPLKEFLKFNRIKSLTDDEHVIATAVKSSQKLELNEAETEVRRKTPVNCEVNTDLCTIYVEGLPAHTDHSWIKAHFSCFGEITYISLPCFKSNGAVKGFAFVEFQSYESVVKACKRFGSKIPAAIPDDKIDLPPVVEETNVSKKRPHESEPQVEASKKLKVDNSNGETDKSSKKTKKKNRRKLKEQCERVFLNDELVMKHLRVMSKQEWLDYKKAYIDLQRSQMSAIKKSLVQEGLNEMKSCSSIEKDISERSDNKCNLSGVVLKMTYKVSSVDEFIESVFRRNIREVCGDSVAYIDVAKELITINADYSEGVCYIRFHNSESADEALNNSKLQQLGSVSKLTQREEIEYWNRIQQCLQKKKQRERNKRRVQRVIERMDDFEATKTHSKVNTHIKFE